MGRGARRFTSSHGTPARDGSAINSSAGASVAALAFYGSYLLGPDRFWPSYVLLFIAGGAMYAPYGPYFASISELLTRDVAAPAIALINAFGALGAFAGSYFVGWLDELTGGASAPRSCSWRARSPPLRC